MQANLSRLKALASRNQVRAVAGLVLVAGAGAANAAAITLPTELSDAALSVVAIGAAVFGIAVSTKLYKWIKAAL